MAIHMSIRLAWHDNGWNGHICKRPCENTYCVGQYSYNGEHIAKTRNLDYEQKYAGDSCCNHPCKIECGMSINAFGKDPIDVKVDVPNFYDSGDPKIIKLPPATVCTWPFEGQWDDSLRVGRSYDYEGRFNLAKSFFEKFELNKSLIFYYSGYSNPFSEDENRTYVLVGISRLKSMDSFYFYDNLSDKMKERYAGGFVWQKPITSNYPEEGFVLPYWKYMADEDFINKLVVKPNNNTPFKYDCKEVTNDDAIEVINQFIKSLDLLIEKEDDTEDWKTRKEWLNNLLNELWKARGPYPGLPSILYFLKLNSLIQTYTNLETNDDMKQFYSEMKNFLEEKQDTIYGEIIENKKAVIREYKLLEEEEQQLLINILPRFDLTATQVENIISEQRKDCSLTTPIKDIISNPYSLCEEYIGFEPDDIIPFYKIDNGVITSPEYGISDLLDSGSSERLRALCVDELHKIAAHTFGKAETIIGFINERLKRMPDWKQYAYRLKNLSIDEEIFEKSLFIRKDENDVQYIYLRSDYEDERIIESTFKMLADRTDISIKMSISKDKFINGEQGLRSNNLEINKVALSQYESILEKQADTCLQIFKKPICVLAGAAGTGKTTVIRTIVHNIKRVHGEAVGILLLAPTGKAAERIKEQTQQPSSTIHSFLASNGWINKNFTLKRFGNNQGQELNTLIIDECSMIELNVFATLVRAINWNSIQRLILVGDPNQLPPIGKGKVFSDTINWLKEEYPNNVGILTENIRQLVNRVKGNGEGILDLASLFIQEYQKSDNPEIITQLKEKKEELFSKIQKDGNGPIDKDLSIYFWKEENDLFQLIEKNLTRDMEDITQKSEYTTLDELWQQTLRIDPEKLNPDIIQVLSPYRGEFYGTESLNSFLQNKLNSKYSAKNRTLDGIALGDKVIQLKNRPKSDLAYAYDFNTSKMERRDIYNGEIGIVFRHPFDKTGWHPKLEHFQVIFSGSGRKNLRYSYGSELGRDSNNKYIPQQKVEDNLELAYAISVHKSQGSEFDNVYIVIPKRDSHLLSMELLYTAITRAQKKVTIFLQDDIDTLSSLTKLEKSAIYKINSSVFKFVPLPDEVLYLNVKGWYEDKKNLATLSEYFVRSKSEVIIANILALKDIPFEYEVPLYAEDGTMYLPDFTVSFKGEKYYWEHVGMLDNPNYKAHWEKKQKWYEKNFPGKLITTYEDNKLSKIVEAIIQEYQ